MLRNARLYIVITLLLVALFNITGLVYAETNIPDANVPSSEQVSPYEVNLAKEELRGDFYKECVHNLWAALTIIVGGVLALILYTIFKDRKEYRIAVSDAKEAAKDAHEWEKEARDILESIDQKVDTKLKEIDKKANERKKETEIDRDISPLWNEAGKAYSAGDYETATKIWQEIYNKYKLESRPFFNNWGSSLLHWGEQETGRKQEQLLNQAIEKYLKAESYTEGVAAYNIACCYAMLNKEEECRSWMEIGNKTGRLLSWKLTSTDAHLKKYAGEDWFIKIWDKS